MTLLLRRLSLSQRCHESVRVSRVYKLIEPRNLLPVLCESQGQRVLVRVRPDLRIRHAGRVDHARVRLRIMYLLVNHDLFPL
jgi:hypothetical protein